jgi:hypothetical protein
VITRNRGGGHEQGSRVLASWSAVVALIGIVGCGGGGNSVEPVNVSLKLAPGESIVETVMETHTMPVQILQGVATGDLASLNGATIYVRIEDPWALFASSSVHAWPDGYFELSLLGGMLTRPGHFTGDLKIHVSLDAEGRRPFGGSPLLVPYDVTVIDPIPLDATSLLVETPFGDPPSTRTIKANVSEYVTDWVASVGTTQGCRGTGLPIDSRVPFQHVGCATDGTISLTFRPAAPGTYPETLTVRANGVYQGGSFSVTRRVGITRMVTPNDAIDFVIDPAQLPTIERTAGDPSFQPQGFTFIPNTGVSALLDGVEYLTSPAAAAGHPQVAAWWQESPSAGTITCDVSAASPECLPEGTYTARLHYVLTRNGVARDAYSPITLDILAASYFPVRPGSYFEYLASGSTNRIQVVASSPTTVTTRNTYSSTPNSYDLNDYVLTGGGAYMLTSRTCSTTSSVCGTSAAYAPPEVIFPSSSALGYSETTVSSVTGAMAYTLTRSLTVDGIESVTVPAGTFSALKITAHNVSSPFDNYNVTWWVRGLGRVKILNYPSSNPSSTQTWVLTGYGDAAIP